MHALGTEIFWTALFSVFAILFISTLIGRAWSFAFPYKNRGAASFYLAPILGLATLTLFATYVGKMLPLGSQFIAPGIIASLLIVAILLEKNKKSALYQASWVSLFGAVCGITVLVPLYLFGGMNVHNDGFLYLTHSNWLQEHAFNSRIPNEDVTPLTTAIAIFQTHGLRMGGSFLLALFQALFKLRWSYEIYPALLIAVVTACCLAIGFPLSKLLKPMQRPLRLALLALPALSLGGLVFGPSNGFFSQTVGLSFGASLLFITGPLFYWIASTKPNYLKLLKATTPAILLLVAVTFSYSELDPFLVLGLVSSAFLIAWRYRAWQRMFIAVSFLFCMAAIILNTELFRVYIALRMESQIVVGVPMAWSLVGYIAHILGVHPGAFGEFYQWSSPFYAGSKTLKLGLIVSSLVVLVLLFEWRRVWRAIKQGPLMPAAMTLAVFLAALLYFRYFVRSPFAIGVGQSWSQFKLSDWAHPCMMVLLLCALTGLASRFGKVFGGIVVSGLFVASLGIAIHLSMVRLTPLQFFYKGVTNLNQHYLTIRKEVNAQCLPQSTIYLALPTEHHKFRQMMAYYFYDREVRSDWTDDGYIYPLLPDAKRKQQANYGDCVIELLDGHLVSHGVEVGSYRIGRYEVKPG